MNAPSTHLTMPRLDTDVLLVGLGPVGAAPWTTPAYPIQEIKHAA